MGKVERTLQRSTVLRIKLRPIDLEELRHFALRRAQSPQGAASEIVEAFLAGHRLKKLPIQPNEN